MIKILSPEIDQKAYRSEEVIHSRIIDAPPGGFEKAKASKMSGGSESGIYPNQGKHNPSSLLGS